MRRLIGVALVSGLVGAGCARDRGVTRTQMDELVRQKVEETERRLATGTTLPAARVPSADEWREFTDPRAGLRMTYPVGWQPVGKPQGTAMAELLFLGPIDEGGGRASVGLEVRRRVGAAEGQSLEAFVGEAVERAKAVFEDFRLIENVETVLGGLPARRLVFEGTQLGLRGRRVQVYAFAGDRQYAWSYTAPPGMIFDKYAPTAEAMRESVRITEPARGATGGAGSR